MKDAGLSEVVFGPRVPSRSWLRVRRKDAFALRVGIFVRMGVARARSAAASPVADVEADGNVLSEKRQKSRTQDAKFNTARHLLKGRRLPVPPLKRLLGRLPTPVCNKHGNRAGPSWRTFPVSCAAVVRTCTSPSGALSRDNGKVELCHAVKNHGMRVKSTTPYIRVCDNIRC